MHFVQHGVEQGPRVERPLEAVDVGNCIRQQPAGVEIFDARVYVRPPSSFEGVGQYAMVGADLDAVRDVEALADLLGEPVVSSRYLLGGRPAAMLGRRSRTASLLVRE